MFQGQVISIKKGPIFHQGFEAKFCYLIKKGRVKLYHQLESGREIVTKIHYPGDWFGEAELLGRATYCCSAAATCPTSLIRVNFDAFCQALDDPESSLDMLWMLTERYQELNEQVAIMGNVLAVERVRGMFYALAARNKGRLVRVTHFEMAGMCGLSRETVTRALGQIGEVKRVARGTYKVDLNREAIA